MKISIPKIPGEHFFVKNELEIPNIVIIFPVTRENRNSITTWSEVLRLATTSMALWLIVVDKTETGSAEKFFQANFNPQGANLAVMRRSIQESHYESLGEIELDKNLWVMQVHDDDEWRGQLELPKSVDSRSIYFSRFIVKSSGGRLIEEDGFTTPARILFSLLPTFLWNSFRKMVQDQGFHVAGSLDSTLNQMALLTCNFVFVENFTYYYDNRNWEDSRSSRKHLTKLSLSDGWAHWASPEIAVLNRLIDNLASLTYAQTFASNENIRLAYIQLMQKLQPSLKHKLWLKSIIFFLKICCLVIPKRIPKSANTSLQVWCQSKLEKFVFLKKTWDIHNLFDLVALIETLRTEGYFPLLHARFSFWINSLVNIESTRSS